MFFYATRQNIVTDNTGKHGIATHVSLFRTRNEFINHTSKHTQSSKIHFVCGTKTTLSFPRLSLTLRGHHNYAMRHRMKLAITVALRVLMAWVISASSSYALPHSMFDMSETFSPNTIRFIKWNTAIERTHAQAELPVTSCNDESFHPCHVVAWENLLKDWKGMKFPARLSAVNAYANTFPYVIDMMNWGIEDFWATPYEFIVKDGDCEDYAIAKYISLRAAGVPIGRMRIIVVQDMNLGGVIHAVLGVYDDKNTLYILDNQIKQVVKASSIYHYKPIYGINEQGWWAYSPRTSGG